MQHGLSGPSKGKMVADFLGLLCLVERLLPSGRQWKSGTFFKTHALKQQDGQFVKKERRER
jgi:hypothetical protein